MKLSTYRPLLITILLFGLFFVWTEKAMSQNIPTESDSTDNVIRIVRFVGNDNVKDNTLETLIRTQTNREFLGIPRFTPWYFIWKLTNRLGEPPSYLNKATVSNDIERIKQYYKTVGFLDAEVDTNIVEFKKDRVEVSFLIDEGDAYSIETLGYTGLPDFEEPEQKQQFLEDSPLTDDKINDSTYAVGQRYSENDLNTERTRIINYLKDNGYAAIQRDSVSLMVKRDTARKNHLDALFVINPGNKYRFGDLHISLSGPGDSLEYNQHDTLSQSPFTINNKSIFLRKGESAQTKFSLLTDQVLFEPGDVFNNSLYIRTVNEFQNLGMLNIRQFGLSEDGGLPDYSKEEIPVMFSLQTLPKHSLNLNFFGMRRYGYGSGSGITYTNNNLFGKAENLQVNVNGSFEYVRSSTVRDIAADEDDESQSFDGRFYRSFETGIDYSLPRLIFPFSALDDEVFFSNARTRYSLSFTRSNQLLFDINSDIRFNLRYEVQHSQRYSSFFDLIELDLLDTDPSPEFEDALENRFGENSFQLQQIREDFRPQVSSIVRYTFRSQRTDLIKRDQGYYSEYSIASGGNIPYLTDRHIVTPDTLEGNLPGIFPGSQNSLAYSRFVKGTADYRRYIPLSDNAVFGYRGFMGVALPYGESTTVPLNQRFYAGGANDIRGWDFYSLGPGAISRNDLTITGGQIKLLSQLELRQQIIGNFLSTDWIGAVFTDAGNVWYGPRTELPTSAPGSNEQTFSKNERDQLLERGKFRFDEFYNQIAVGSGIGLRLDWDYVVIRFDFAFRIHDLQQGWFQDKSPYFTFGIGQSF
ncbi:MAG: BamA/TamA family outer membrane protein [Bacteroidota bacterium]